MDKIKNFFSKNELFKANNANNNTTYGISNFLQANIFYLVLVVFIGIIIFYVVYLIKERKNMKGPKEIKPKLNIYRVDDNLRHKPVLNQRIECPKRINQYSFSFFIQLNEFYCNTGYWKAIIVKGQEVNNNTIPCGILYEKNIDAEDCFESYDGYKDTELKTILDSSLDTKIDVKDLSKRLQVICQAIKVDNNDTRDGTNLLCHAATHCNLFTQDGEKLKMSQGQCSNFVQDHKGYCDNIYKLDEKVARTGKVDIRKEKKGNYEIKYYDNYDNICSQDNLLEKYPELLPKNLDTLKDLKLINLSEKMDIRNGESRIDKTLEGCYDFESLGNIIEKEGIDNENNDILQECNKLALGKANYFGIKDNECYTIDLSKENELLQKIKKNNQECKYNNTYRTPVENNIFISRALRPEENILIKCWENIIDTYPIQNPGIWLHPYKNDLRIVLTTVSNDPQSEYDKYLNEMIHPYKETNFLKLKNYNIIPISEDIVESQINKHAFYSPGESINKCNRDMSNNNYYYKEYFDVKNIPIKEKFHFAIVVNEKSVEIYINGQLNTTQFLFGNPNYNSGPLHINPGKNENGGDLNLNGMITDFKYFNKSINYNNIINIMKEKSIIQEDENPLNNEELNSETQYYLDE